MNSQGKNRTERLSMRLSTKEKAKINELAQELGMDTSTYARDRALKGKAANRYANRKAATGIVRTSNAIYCAYDMLAQTNQETFTKTDVISLLDPIKKEVDSIWHK